MSRNRKLPKVHRERAGARRVAVSSAACLAALLVPLGLASPASAAPALHLSFNGRVAIGSWTTCPDLQVGDTCLDTVIIASDARTYENSDQPEGGHFLRDSGDRVVLQKFWYEVRLFEGEPSIFTTRESFGGTDVAVDVQIDNRLTSATAIATSIPMNTTDFVTGESFSETASVEAIWEPASPLTVIRERERFTGGDVFILSSTTGWSRDAVVSGLDGGGPIPGTSAAGTTMFSVRQAELTVVKGAPKARL